MFTIDNLPGPEQVIQYRSERYIGENQGITLDSFSQLDRELTLKLYSLLKQSLNQVQHGIERQDPPGTLKKLDALRWKETLETFSLRFGRELIPGVPKERARQILHDIRGSALSIAAGRVDLARLKGNESEVADLYPIFYAIRDHLKILRNCVVDLDTERRERDLRLNHHSTALLREKWQSYVTPELEVEYIADYDGDVSSCCLEFSSLERVLYNLINNGANHTADGKLRFFVTTVGPEAAPSAKFALANRVEPEELRQMEERFGGQLGALFDGGFTIGGSGVGLSVVAQIVANAYGLEHPSESAELGYVGATVEDGEFLAWAHWPTV